MLDNIYTQPLFIPLLFYIDKFQPTNDEPIIGCGTVEADGRATVEALVPDHGMVPDHVTSLCIP